MKARKNPFSRSVASTTMIVAFCFVQDNLSAANLWDAGGGASTNWTTAANWDDDNTATSGSGNDVAFGAGTTSLNDYAGYVAWRSIIFNSGLSTFVLNSSVGANWDLYFKIENLSGNKATINIDNISLKGSGNEFDPTAGDLTINTQNVFTNGNNLNVYGTKILTVSNVGGSGITGTGGLTLNSLFSGTTILTGSNNYTGATSINGGKLQINNGGSTASGSAVTVSATGAGALTINSGGTVGGNVTVAPSSTTAVANLANNGTISGTLTINSSAVPAPIKVQANTVISGNANLGSGSSTGNILNDGQLTISGAVAATTGTVSSTGTGSGASAGTGAIFLTNSGGSSLTFANGSSFAWLGFGNSAVGSLNTSGTVSLYGYSQNSSLSSAVPYTININSGTWNVGQVGQNNSGKVATGTTNILGGSTFNLGAMATWSGLGASNGAGFMHGIWNIGGVSSGTMNITGGFSEGGGFSTAVPTSGAINGLQFTVGNGGALTTTTASTLGFATVQVAGQTTAQTTNSLIVNAGGTVTTVGNFTLANTTVAQTNTTTSNSLTVNGGTFSNSGGVLYIGNTSLANTLTQTNSVTVAGGTLNQAGAAVSLGASGIAATNYTNILNISSGAMNIGTSASAQALQVGTAQNTASSVSNTVNLSGGKLVVSGQISALAGTGQVNTFNWTGGQLTAGSVTTTSATWAAAGGGGIASSILNNTGGTFAPGDIGTGGKTTVTGGYTQGANGTLAIDLGSATVATVFQSGVAFYDTIAMTGALSLDGILSVSAINSYTPSGTFSIITGATSNTGIFTNVNAVTNRVNLTNGGSMVFTRSATSTLSAYSSAADLIWAGDGATNVWDTAIANWTKGGVASTYSNANADYVTFGDTGSQTPAVALNSTLSPTGVYFANTSGTYTISGTGKISGAATVTVQGAGGTVSLNTANDYAGATSVSAGTLKLGNATALGTTAGGTSVTAGAVLDLNGQAVGAEALAINGTGISSGGALINSSGTAASLSGLVTFSTGTSIGGSGSFTLSGGIAATASTNNLIKVGAGAVALSAAATTNRSTVNATTQIDAGVLRIQNASALATGNTAVTTINGGVLELNGGITFDQPITLNHGGTVRSDGTNGTTGKITVSTAVGANTVTLSTVGSGDVFTVGNGSNDITGGNGNDDTINVSGPGTVLLGQASDYVGNWSFNAGTAQLGSGTALGATAASTITLNGGALNGRLAGNTTFTANPVAVIANSSLNADRSSNGGGLNYTFGTLSIGANTLNVTSTAAITSGTGGVIVGATTLTGNATFNITNGATATTQLTVGAITDNGNQLTLIGSGNFAQSAAWASGTAGSLRLGASGGAAYSGTATLNQANTFTGGVTVNSGTLLIGGTATATGSTINTSATGTSNVSFASGTSVSSSNGATWFAPTITLGGAGSTLNLIGGNRLAVAYKNLDLGDAGRSGLTTVNVNSKSLAVTGGDTLASESTGLWSWETATTLGTPVIQNGTLDLQTTSFSGSNYGAFFIRSTTFSNADLNIGANVILGANGSSALGTNATTSPNLTVSSGGILNMLGTSKTVKSLAGGGSIYNSMLTASTSPSTLNIVGTSGSTTFAGVLSNGPGSGALSVTKTGAATQIFSGTNIYSGTTTVSGGTLVINGDHSGATGAVNVGGNGSSGTPTLAGSGTIGGATTIAAAGSGVVGTHSPGVTGVSNGVGTQTFSSTLDYGTGSIFEWSFQAASTSDPGVVSNAATGTYDKVVAGGAVTGSGAVFKIVLGGNAFTDAFWNTDKTWTDIFSGAGAPSNLASIFTTFSGTNVNTDGTVTGNSGYFTFNGSSTLTWSAVPEPTSALAGLLIAAGLLRRRRSA